MEPLTKRSKHGEQVVHRLFTLIRVGMHLLGAGPLKPAFHDLLGILLKDVTDRLELLLEGRMAFP
ncbi:MAG: hypothetical protein WD534_05310 [Phycisphaeraceae bacterium]